MAKPKAYVSQLTLHFGSSTTVGSIYPIRKTSEKPKFKYCTPDGKPVSQVYVDEDGKLWETDQLNRSDGENVVSTSAVDEAKESDLPLNILNLTAHARSDIEQYIFPSQNQAYIFKPVVKNTKGKEVKDPINLQWHDFINTILAETDVALIGKCNLRNHEGLFRLGLYQGHITVQKQLFPEELNQYDPVDSRLELPLRQKALEIARKAAKDFEPAEYVDVIAKRLANVQDGTGVQDARALEFKNTELDMAAALDSFMV